MARVQAESTVDVKQTHTGTFISRTMVQIIGVCAHIVADTLMTIVAFVLAYRLRFSTDLLPIQHVTSLSEYTQMVAVTVLTLLMTLAIRGQYAPRPGVASVDLAWHIAAGVSIGVSVSVALTTLLFKFDYPRAALVVAWALSIFLIVVVRLVFREFGRVLRAHGVGRSTVLIVGAGDSGRAVAQRMREVPGLGYYPIGFLDADERLRGSAVSGCPVFGSPAILPHIVQRYAVNEVVLATPNLSGKELMALVARVPSSSIGVKLFPDLFQITTSAVSVDDLGGLPLMTVKRGALRAWDRMVKRTVDVIISAVALVLLSVPLLLVAILVKSTSRGPVFYAQERVGHNGLRFKALKFRGMLHNPHNASGPGWTKRNDGRVTSFGSFIRRHSIDEMPQFLNVLAGQMSIVGPRPEQPVYVEQFAATIPRYMDRHQEKCGLTGWAQVNGMRGDTPIDERTRYDLYYVDNWSLLLDLKIMVMTLRHLIVDDRAY